MAGAVGDDWVYVLSQQDDGDNAAEKEKTSAQPPELDNKAVVPLSSEFKDGGGTGTGGAQSHSDSDDDDQDAEYPDWYTPEEVEVEKAYDAYMAALDRARGLACKVADDKSVEIEMDKAFWAYVAALDRRAAAKIDGRLIDRRLVDEALRTYRAACKRAAKILGDSAGAAGGSINAGGGRRPRAVVEKEEKPRYDPYNDGETYRGNEPAAGQSYRGYGGGSSAPASRGPTYDDSYYNRYGFGFPGAHGSGSGYGYGYGYEYYDGYYGFGFPGAATGYDYGLGYPGAAYGPATGYSYDGYGGYAEPYASYLPPGYQTTAVYLAPPPPAMNAGSFYPLQPPPPMPSVYMALAPPSAPVSIRHPDVAPTTQPPPEPSCSWD